MAKRRVVPEPFVTELDRDLALSELALVALKVTGHLVLTVEERRLAGKFRDDFTAQLESADFAGSIPDSVVPDKALREGLAEALATIRPLWDKRPLLDQGTLQRLVNHLSALAGGSSLPDQDAFDLLAILASIERRAHETARPDLTEISSLLNGR